MSSNDVNSDKDAHPLLNGQTHSLLVFEINNLPVKPNSDVDRAYRDVVALSAGSNQA